MTKPTGQPEPTQKQSEAEPQTRTTPTPGGTINFILHIEWPSHPSWNSLEIPVELGRPFYLVGSEGKYILWADNGPAA